MSRRVLTILRAAAVVGGLLVAGSGEPIAAAALLAAVAGSFAPRVAGSSRGLDPRPAVELLVLIVLLVFAGQLAGTRLALFGRLWWWDILLHGAAGFAVGLAAILAAPALLGPRLHGVRGRVAVAILAFGAAMAVGALWEVFEFVLGRLIGVRMQPSLADTMLDLVVDGVGSMVAIAWALVAGPRTTRLC